MHPSKNVTRLLVQWSDGNEEAREKLMAAVYAELHRLASHRLRKERSSHTLQATALVHEAYLRLIGQRRVRWQDRAQFFAIASQTMRRILVDHARRRQAQKRGGKDTCLPLDEAQYLTRSRDLDIEAIDEALQALARLDARQAKVVELRFFGGLTIEEVAQVLEIAPVTVRRDWASAKAWLFNYIHEE